MPKEKKEFVHPLVFHFRSTYCSFIKGTNKQTNTEEIPSMKKGVALQLQPTSYLG